MGVRYGEQNGQAAAYGEAVAGRRRHRDLRAGGACARARRRSSSTMAASGSSYRATISAGADPTCAGFEPVPCDVFVTEATFGLPVFRHPDTGTEIAKITTALQGNPDRCVLVGAYALGKAQRVIAELRQLGHDAPIYLHGAVQRLCDLYVELGVDLGDLRPATGVEGGRPQGRGRHRPAVGAQRPLEPPPARADHGDGEGLDARPPARGAAHGRAAADRLRPRRLGRADGDLRRTRAVARCG